MARLSKSYSISGESLRQVLSNVRRAVAEQQASPEEAVKKDVGMFGEACHMGNRDGMLTKAALVVQGVIPLEKIPGITEEEIEAVKNEQEHRWSQPKMLYFTILTCSMGAIEQGWAQTAMNGANLYFPKALGIDSGSKHDTLVVGFINSAVYISIALMGAWLADPINNRFGRRGAVFIGSLLCLIANLGGGFSQTWVQLLISRLVLGLGLGINASTVSIYAIECAPSYIRGGLAVSWQMFVAFGIFLGFMTNAAVYKYGETAWRYQLALAFVPTVPTLIMIYFCPESPGWCIKAGGRYDLAFKSLRKMRNTEIQAAKGLYMTYLQQRNKPAGPQGVFSFFHKILELFTIPRNRRAVQASYTVMLGQQLCGINIISFYSSSIFTQAGFTTFGALLASCVFGFVNFVGAFPAVWTMDTLGRRSLLLLTLPIMSVTMLAAALSFSIPTENPAHFGLLATLIYLFCAIYSPGMGPVPPAYSAEVFPLSHREVGNAMAVATANIWAALLSLTFPGLLSSWGAGPSFGLYAGLNIVALVLVFLFMPETRLSTLDELDEVFSVPTREFIKYQVTEWLPWFVKYYILREKDAELQPLLTEEDEAEYDEYTSLLQNGDDDEIARYG